MLEPGQQDRWPGRAHFPLPGKEMSGPCRWDWEIPKSIFFDRLGDQCTTETYTRSIVVRNAWHTILERVRNHMHGLSYQDVSSANVQRALAK